MHGALLANHRLFRDLAVVEDRDNLFRDGQG